MEYNYTPTQTLGDSPYVRKPTAYPCPIVFPYMWPNNTRNITWPKVTIEKTVWKYEDGVYSAKLSVAGYPPNDIIVSVVGNNVVVDVDYGDTTLYTVAFPLKANQDTLTAVYSYGMLTLRCYAGGRVVEVTCNEEY